MGMIDLRRRLIDRMPHKKTAEGAVASFSTDVKAPLKVLFELKPIQAGSGDPAPDNVRAISGHDSTTIMHHGGNLLKGKFSSGKSGSVTFTVNDDGSVSTDGTSTSTAVLRSDGISVDEGGTYKLYGCPHGGDNSTYRLDVRDSDGNIINSLPYDIGNGANITIPSGTTTIKITGTRSLLERLITVEVEPPKYHLTLDYNDELSTIKALNVSTNVFGMVDKIPAIISSDIPFPTPF